MELTDDQTAVLAHLEHHPIVRYGLTETAHAPVLADLEQAGLVRTTTTNWVLTADGRRELVAVDGRTRLTVDRWNANSKGAPS
jgi:hypothetical protein